MQGHGVDESRKLELFRALGSGRKEEAWAGRQTQRGRVMFGHMIAVETGAIIALDKLQAHVVAVFQDCAATVKVIEDPKFHQLSNRLISLASVFGVQRFHMCGAPLFANASVASKCLMVDIAGSPAAEHLVAIGHPSHKGTPKIQLSGQMKRSSREESLEVVAVGGYF